MKRKAKHKDALLAVGADIKNRILLSRGDELCFGADIGDLGDAANYEKFKDQIRRFARGETVATVAYDPHPGYFSSRFALQNEFHAAHLVPVQHHHAHIASVLQEHALKPPVMGVSFDGTGFGPDGNIWGGEFLLVDAQGCKRVAHLKYQKMPGAEKVVREPWRMALSILDKKGAAFLRLRDKKSIDTVLSMLKQDINVPLTSSAGRLFDAAAALLGIAPTAAYEAEGPIKLEALCRQGIGGEYDFDIISGNGGLVIDPRPVFDGMIKDMKKDVRLHVMATKFHRSMARIIVDAVKKISRKTRLKTVALSGGVFQNKFFKNLAMNELSASGYQVYTNETFPVNDLNISLGQYYVSCGSGKN